MLLEQWHVAVLNSLGWPVCSPIFTTPISPPGTYVVGFDSVASDYDVPHSLVLDLISKREGPPTVSLLAAAYCALLQRSGGARLSILVRSCLGPHETLSYSPGHRMCMLHHSIHSLRCMHRTHPCCPTYAAPRRRWVRFAAQAVRVGGCASGRRRRRRRFGLLYHRSSSCAARSVRVASSLVFARPPPPPPPVAARGVGSPQSCSSTPFSILSAVV
jgi:hypothetical protein